ncbi:MAG TPA: DUF1924 domain-containing protein [Mariprofundaceae bacterium]|nr:DUF1924 domain-containing protein [Mariprofundaceae bacterium]
MKKQLSTWILPMIVAVAGFSVVAFAAGNVIPQMLSQYKAEGAKDFSAARGEAFWTKKHDSTDPEDNKPRSCTTCHGTDLKKAGSHVRTGKVIDPMAFSVNSERYTDPDKIEKWFLRNCKWTLGRECTAQEKGDVLTYLGAQ